MPGIIIPDRILSVLVDAGFSDKSLRNMNRKELFSAFVEYEGITHGGVTSGYLWDMVSDLSKFVSENVELSSSELFSLRIRNIIGDIQEEVSGVLCGASEVPHFGGIKVELKLQGEPSLVDSFGAALLLRGGDKEESGKDVYSFSFIIPSEE